MLAKFPPEASPPLRPAAAAPNSALMVCVTEDKLTTEVKGGENKGKTLTHNGVVRAAATLGVIRAKGCKRSSRVRKLIASKRSAP